MLKSLFKNITRLGIILVAVLLFANLAGFTFTASAQTSTESDFLNILNTQRLSLGENSLAANSSLSTAAYLHSKDMAENGYFSHVSQDGRTFDQRIVAAGYTNWTGLAENIAYYYGQPDAATIYNMWKNSPGHYTNMIGNYNDAGLGVYTLNNYTYCTLDLGKSSSPVPPPSPNFSLSASPVTLNIGAGSSTTSVITVSSVNSFTGSVGLTFTQVPAGWTVTLAPTSLAILSGSYKSSVLTITVPSTASAAKNTLTVTATNGSLSHSTALTVNTQGIAAVASAPRSLTATAGNAQIALTWSTPLSNGASPVLYYRVYRRTASTSATLLATPGNVLSYKDSTAANGTTCYYTVTAVNSVGESTKSNEAYATPAAPTNKLLKVGISTNSPVYSIRSIVNVALIVTDSSSLKPVAGAKVTIKFYNPTGALIRTIFTTTGSNGKAQVLTSVRFNDPSGTYKITASVSQTGYQIGTGQITYTVK
jgi:hypothetical protein